MQTNRTLDTSHDVIIVGAGPGGLTAGLYTSRSNLSTLILEQGAPGGELLNTSEIDNFPAFPLIGGPELAAKLYESSLRFGAQQTYGQVEKVQVLADGRLQVQTADTDYQAPVVILSTGATHRKLGVPGEAALTGRGVSYCAVCDGFFFKDRELVVIGGGDSAVEEAVYLTQFAKKVTIIHRRDELRAQKFIQDKAFANPKIDFLWDCVVEEIKGQDKVEAVQVRQVKTGEIFDYPTDGAFIYVGILPNSDLVADLGITDEEGWILTDETMATQIPGLYAVGDVRKTPLRQIVTAIGDGGHAGHAAYNYLQFAD